MALVRVECESCKKGMWVADDVKGNPRSKPWLCSRPKCMRSRGDLK